LLSANDIKNVVSATALVVCKQWWSRNYIDSKLISRD